jgi:hypothetical protein
MVTTIVVTKQRISLVPNFMRLWIVSGRFFPPTDVAKYIVMLLCAMTIKGKRIPIVGLPRRADKGFLRHFATVNALT